MYKCPYCDRTTYTKRSKFTGNFLNWKAVRDHVHTCKKNNKNYVICEYYGPIHLNIINSYSTTMAFKKDYPLLSFNHNFFSDLRKDKKSSIRGHWNKQTIINCIIDFYSKYGTIPSSREFEKELKYPSVSTVQSHFGSWNVAIEAAGFKPNTLDGFGIPTVGIDGHMYKSKAEAKFVELYLYEKYKYVIEPKYPEPYNLIYDWYIPELDLYIELDGGLRPQTIQEKIEINKKLGRKLLVVPISDMNKIVLF